MSVAWLEQNLVGVCWIGVMGSALGLVGLTCRFGRGIVAPALMAGLLGGAAAVFAATGSPIGLWLAPAILATVCGGAAVLRSPRSAVALAAFLKMATSPRLHGAILLVGSPIAATCWAWALVPTVPEIQIQEPSVAESAIDNKCLAGTTAATDAGKSVPLFVRLANAPARELRAADAKTFSDRECAGRALRTAPPSDDYNCHGWVFTEGRFGIQSEDVDVILRDNHYYEVSDPRPGDLVVYRVANAVTHSGIVRTAGPGQPLLVESKWGNGARYVHAPHDAPYEGRPTFYRSERAGGHVLRGAGSIAPTHRLATTTQDGGVTQ
jgi:hypothetical protein